MQEEPRREVADPDCLCAVAPGDAAAHHTCRNDTYCCVSTAMSKRLGNKVVGRVLLPRICIRHRLVSIASSTLECA